MKGEGDVKDLAPRGPYHAIAGYLDDTRDGERRLYVDLNFDAYFLVPKDVEKAPGPKRYGIETTVVFLPPDTELEYVSAAGERGTTHTTWLAGDVTVRYGDEGGATVFPLSTDASHPNTKGYPCTRRTCRWVLYARRTSKTDCG